jgi:tRNA threonylcarbamoyladenosine biosynthesis protein TsaE
MNLNKEMQEFEVDLKGVDQVAEAIIKLVSATPIITFTADLGGGKTTLIQAICAKIGVKSEVTSPSYTLINEYECENKDVVYHFDFYRIDDFNEALDLGCEEYFDSGNICLIEWPKIIENLLPEDIIAVEINYAEEKRKYTIELKNLK